MSSIDDIVFFRIQTNHVPLERVAAAVSNHKFQTGHTPNYIFENVAM